MYAGDGGGSEDLAALGIPTTVAGSFAGNEVDVWPEHEAALELFVAVSTQWRIGMSGPTGLDYAAVMATMDVLGVAPAERRERFDEMRIMERAAMNELTKNRN